MTWISYRTTSSDFPAKSTVDDKIDLFREQTLGWQLAPADACINGVSRLGLLDGGPAGILHSGYAVLAIVFSYFEMIGKLRAGFAETGKSRYYFRKGLLNVFPALEASGPEVQKDIVEILYQSGRCGLYHAGKVGVRMPISGDWLYPLRYDSESRKLRINPHRLVPELIKHLELYVRELKDPGNGQLRCNFERTYDWTITQDPLVPKP